MSSTPTDTEDDVDADGQTSSTDTRFWLTNDLLAGFLNLSMVGLLAATSLGVELDPPGQLLSVFVAVVALANLWAFGSKAASKLGDLIAK